MKVKVLAATSKSYRQAIIVHKEKVDEIKNINDLVGKKIAVPKGSCSHYFLYRTLIGAGVEPKSINMIDMSIKDQTAALLSNQIDVCVAWEALPTKLEKEKIGKILKEGELSGYVYAREDFISKNSEAVQAFIDAMQEGLEYSQKNFDQTSQWVAEETKESPDIIRDAAKTDRIFESGEDIKPETELIKDLEEGAEFLLEQGLITNIPDFLQKIDLDFINKTLEKKK
jgi:sulfonate transport system substrate-binding protein